MSLYRNRMIDAQARTGKKPTQIKGGSTQQNYYNGKTQVLTPSKTEQHHKDDVRMQKILQKYKQTGVISHVNKHQGTYMDLADAPTYQEAQNIIAQAAEVFESVPAHIREHVNNDPQQFIDFMQDEANRSKMEEFGLDTGHLPPLPDPKPQPGPKSPTEEPGSKEEPAE